MNKCQGPQHFNQQFAGQTLEWSHTDTQSNWQNNLADPHKRQRLYALGWIDCAVSYAYNSEGFRDTEFDSTKSVIALGCSHTEGTGIDYNRTWPKQLESMLGMKVWNLGVGGASLDTCVRLLDYWITKLNAVMVVCAVPGIERFEICKDRRWITVLPQHCVYPDINWLEGYNKNYILNSGNGEVNRRKNLLAMQYLCHSNGVKFHYNLLRHFIDSSSARDLQHCGVESHRRLAQQFLQQIHNKETIT